MLLFPDLVSAQSWVKSQYLLTIRLHFSLNQRFSLHAGLNNPFNFGSNGFKTNTYILRGEIGSDILIKQRISLGVEVEYSQDLTPCYTPVENGINYYFQSLSIKVAYIFSKAK